tara:strand:+ start:614 stop:2320 length:1707 start_codon:yes stop_codon:yes gene_type:complete
MAINTEKLIPSSKTQKISAKSVENISIVATKLIDVDTILKGSLLLDNMRDKKNKQAAQRKKRDEKEAGREKKGGLGEGIKKKAMSATAGMRDWFQNLLKGVVIIGLVKLIPIIEPWLPRIGEWVDGFITVAGWVFKGLVTLIDWGYKAYDGLRGFVKNVFGEEGVKKFDTLMGNLNNLFNAIIMVGMAFMKFGFLRKIFKRGLGRVLKRGAIKVFGKGGGKIVGKIGSKIMGGISKAKGAVGGLAKKAALKMFGKTFVKTAGKMFGRIPIVGPLIVGIVSLLTGEPVTQALFKAFGAAIGGLLGSFIPIPILGTLIGETIGVFVGDLFYELLFGGGLSAVGKRLKEALMGIFRAGKAVFNWVGGGFKRFYAGIPKFKVPDLPEDPPKWIPSWVPRKKALWGAARVAIKAMIGPLSLLMGKEIPNLLWLMNPLNYGKLLVKSFFPPGGGKSASAPEPPSPPRKPKKKVVEEIEPPTLIKALKQKARKKEATEESNKKSTQAMIAKEQSGKETPSLESYPTYDEMSPQTAMIPLPPQVLPVGEDQSISFDSRGATGGEDPYESLYAGGLV